MALANLRYGAQRRDMHLFDSWGDWPDPTERNGNRFADLREGRLVKADNMGALGECRRLLDEIIDYPIERISFHRGLYESTIPAASEWIEQIALLRIDCDWYESTKLCLERLAPRLADGGVVVVVDDYGYCDGAKRAVDEHLDEHGGEPLHFVDNSCRYFLKNS